MIHTLNLANPKNSLIEFTVSRFPDGQQSLTLSGNVYLLGNEVTIASRLNSFLDLEVIICATQALKEAGASRINLYIPYCIGARSDRKFSEGGFNYVKTVIAPIINSQGYSWVKVLDPHSDVLEACINNFSKVNNFALVKDALTKIDNRDGAQDRIVLVSPDAGAYKKVFDVAKEFNIDNIVTATKVRDLKTGQILKTEVPNLPVSVKEEEFKYVIVDDICDGGRTFIELAKAIKEIRPNAEIYLVVTHGIFSGGFDELREYFNGIYTTNSIGDFYGVDAPSTSKPITFKQLNLFGI